MIKDKLRMGIIVTMKAVKMRKMRMKKILRQLIEEKKLFFSIREVILLIVYTLKDTISSILEINTLINMGVWELQMKMMSMMMMKRNMIAIQLFQRRMQVFILLRKIL